MVSTSYSKSKPEDTLRGGVAETHGVGVGSVMLRGGLERAPSDAERVSVRSVAAEMLRLGGGECAVSGDEMATSSGGVASRADRFRDGAGLTARPGLSDRMKPGDVAVARRKSGQPPSDLTPESARCRGTWERDGLKDEVQPGLGVCTGGLGAAATATSSCGTDSEVSGAPRLLPPTLEEGTLMTLTGGDPCATEGVAERRGGVRLGAELEV